MADRLTRKIDWRFFGEALRDDSLLDRIDSVVEMLDGGERLVDRELEEADQEVIGAVPEAIPGIAFDVEPVLIENGQEERYDR